MQICVRMLTGKEITLPAVRPTTSADEVKAIVHDQEGLLPDQIRLVFAGREMKGEESLSDHRVTEHARCTWSCVFSRAFRYSSRPSLARRLR